MFWGALRWPEITLDALDKSSKRTSVLSLNFISIFGRAYIPRGVGDRVGDTYCTNSPVNTSTASRKSLKY